MFTVKLIRIRKKICSILQKSVKKTKLKAYTTKNHLNRTTETQK